MNCLSYIGINLFKVVGYSRSNRPDIVLWNKSNKHAYLIDVSIPCDNNLHSEFCDKITKYSDLAMLMKLTEHIVVIISISGLILLESKSALEHIAEKADIVRIISMIQKTALLGSCRIMRSVLLRD